MKCVKSLVNVVNSCVKDVQRLSRVETAGRVDQIVFCNRSKNGVNGPSLAYSNTTIECKELENLIKTRRQKLCQDRNGTGKS